MDNDELNDCVETAVRAARRAGEVMREAAKGEIEVDREEDHDIKLQADRLCEDAILATIRQRHPTHAVLSEEAGRLGGDRAFRWIVDPLDGTGNYSRRIPFFCASIALMRGDEGVLGVIYDPVRDELFVGTRPGQATLNGEPIHPSDRRTLRQSVIAYGFMKTDEAVRKGLDRVNRVAVRARHVRNMGAAALHMAYVAWGRIDAFFEYGVAAWDVAAGAVILRAAGGRVDMRPIGHDYYDIVASNSHVHDELCRTVWPGEGPPRR